MRTVTGFRAFPRQAGPEIAVGARPWGIALVQHGARLLTANGPGADLAVVDTRTLSVIGRVSTGHGSWSVVAEP